jgi:hypothetical protein
MQEVYLVHHNRPELLIAQISILNKLNPEIKVNVVLTCNYLTSPVVFIEFMEIIDKLNLKLLLSDCNLGSLEKLKNLFFALRMINSITLRTPYLRQRFGQDPSSGHARALNKVLKDTIHKERGTEIWIIEGDVFPLSKFWTGESKFDIYGSVTNLTLSNKKYFNGRVFNYRLNPYVLKLIKEKKLTFTSKHTFNNWFDTGSKTDKLIISNDVNGEIRVGAMPGIIDNQWKNSDLERVDFLFPGFLSLVEKDTRSIAGNCSFDFYDEKWLHIGKSSGYFKFACDFDFSNFCSEVCYFASNQVRT